MVSKLNYGLVEKKYHIMVISCIYTINVLTDQNINVIEISIRTAYIYCLNIKFFLLFFLIQPMLLLMIDIYFHYFLSSVLWQYMINIHFYFHYQIYIIVLSNYMYVIQALYQKWVSNNTYIHVHVIIVVIVMLSRWWKTWLWSK